MSGWILVETNKRSYCVRAMAKVLWERGERVIRIEPIER